MNRLSTTNLLQVITQDVEFQTQPPFLLYKSNGGIFCVWFYDVKECDRIGRLFQSLTMSSSKAKYRQRCASESDSRLRQGLHNGATRDIVTLLSKAKDEYNMKKADTGSSQKRRERRSATSSLAAEGEPVLHKPTPVRRTNGAPPAAPSTPLSVASLFAAASSPRGAPGDARDSLMRALLANPDNRLEHVERAQQQGGTGAAEEDPPDEGRLRAASCQANLSSWEEGLPPVVTPAMLELGPLASPPATSDLPLLTPEAFTRPAADPPPVPALTKDQLRDALIHLLQCRKRMKLLKNPSHPEDGRWVCAEAARGVRGQPEVPPEPGHHGGGSSRPPVRVAGGQTPVKAPLVPGRAEPRAVTVVNGLCHVGPRGSKGGDQGLVASSSDLPSCYRQCPLNRRRGKAACRLHVRDLLWASAATRAPLGLRSSSPCPGQAVWGSSKWRCAAGKRAPAAALVPGPSAWQHWASDVAANQGAFCARRVLEVTMGGRKVLREPCAVLASLHVCVVCTVGCRVHSCACF
ncbi:decapping mRNA 1 isoform X2 [Haemaphysalis longicornis]